MKTKLHFLQWLLTLMITVSSLGVMAQVGSLTLTDPQTVCLNTTRDYGVEETAGSTYAWSIIAGTGGAGTITIGITPNLISVNWTGAGTCTLQVIETGSNGCGGSIVQLPITVNDPPSATIAYAGTPYCATGTASVTQTGQAGGTYSALPAGLTIDAGTGDIDLANSAAGTYTVTYAFTDGTCSNTATTSVTVNALPTATISYAGTPYCATGTATVTQTGQVGGSYSALPAGLAINAGTGDIDLANSAAGTYTVTYTFTDGTCSNTTTALVTVNALPTATISYSGTPYCATGTATVTQTGQAGGSYSAAPAGLTINAGTGEIDLANSSAGTYTVTYAFTDGTCSSTATTSVTVNATPTANISYAGTPYCATGTATVTQTGQAGGSYSAAPAGLSINLGTGEIDLVASTPGTYIVTYTFTDGTCSNTTTTSVTVNALPTATIAYSGTPYCATGTATVTQTGQAGGSYSAAPAGLAINAGTGEIDLAASTPGSYTVTYTFTDGTCSNTTTTAVSVSAAPAPAITGSTPVCEGVTEIYTTALNGTNTYLWTVSAGGSIIGSATGNTVNVIWTTSGTITIDETAGSCIGTDLLNVTVNPKPTTSAIYHD
jgi:hypothetical protein